MKLINGGDVGHAGLAIQGSSFTSGVDVDGGTTSKEMSQPISNKKAYGEFAKRIKKMRISH